jgi:DNA-binding response OmpR family regulator
MSRFPGKLTGLVRKASTEPTQSAPLFTEQSQSVRSEKTDHARNLASGLIPKLATASVCWFDGRPPNPGRNRSRVTGSPKIVLVEDEAFQREVIAECLAQHGLRPTALSSGAELKRLAQYSMPDIALLDVHLNEPEDGFALARWLRSRSARIGILMLTVAGDTIDRVVGLESGADDYVVKPFEPRELVARVKALLRRTRRTPQPPRISEVRIGMAMLDLQRRLLVLADGAEAKLSASEFELLRLFV